MSREKFIEDAKSFFASGKFKAVRGSYCNYDCSQGCAVGAVGVLNGLCLSFYQQINKIYGLEKGYLAGVIGGFDGRTPNFNNTATKQGIEDGKEIYKYCEENGYLA